MFAPSNLPATALAGGAPGEMVFNGTNCGAVNTMPELDTDTGMLRSCSNLKLGTNYRYAKVAQSDGSMVGLFVTRVFRIDTTLTLKVQGQVPLVIVALDRIEILGGLDAAPDDNKGLAGGFSARTNMKGDGNGPGAGKGSATGGGGGGSYCGMGGKAGGSNVAGSKYGKPEGMPLIGGSSGGNGGIYEAGAGGGAVQLVAGGTISVTATGWINVGGAGGMQAGAGGGSGGLLLLEAPMVNVSGKIGANGGAGGSGTGAVHGADSTPDDQAAKGGADAMMEAPGGNGSAGAMINGMDGKANPRYADGNFSGGGGGGAGYIRINTMTGMAQISGVISPSAGTPCFTQGALAK